MNASRESVDLAAFAKLQALPGFVTTQRKFVHFSDMSSDQMPALLMVRRGEQVTQPAGQPSVTTISYDLLLYVQTGSDETIAPSTVLNPLVDSVVNAFPVDNFNSQACTLGGLVVRAWIEGHIETDEGLLGQQGYAIVPLSIKAL